MDLGRIVTTPKTGQETFRTSEGITAIRLLDFWQWSVSDLLSNATRGILAEFIVASALGVVRDIRNEWDAYDLSDHDGTKIEIKSSGYLQSWHQNEYSKISFNVKPAIYWNPDTNQYEGGPVRQSDYYVFCLLHHKDQGTIDPLDLSQWTFYLVPTDTLNQKLKGQKSIRLSSLLKLNPIVCQYREVRRQLDKLKREKYPPNIVPEN